MESIVIPDGIKKIENDAFYKGSNLTGVLLPSTIETINDDFYGSSSLRNLYYAGSESDWQLVNGIENLTSYVINYNWVTDLPVIQNGIIYIDKGDYILVTGYEGTASSITIASEVDGKPVLGIGANTFKNMNCITDVKLPNGMQSIGAYAFAGATGLKEVAVYGTATSEVASISDVMAIDIDGVDELEMSIGKNAFDGCSLLETVAIPEGVTAIDEYAFNDCTELTTIAIPISLVSIDETALAGATSLEEIRYEGTEEEWGAIAGKDTVEELVDTNGGEILFEEDLQNGETENEQPENDGTPSTPGGNSNAGGTGGGSSGESNSTTSSSSSSSTTADTEEESTFVPTITPSTDAGTSTALTFTDTASHWAKASIDFMVERGLMSGTGNGNFSPNTPITRGMFIAVLSRYSAEDLSGYATSSFTDVPADSYYMKDIEWAKANGIVNGMSATSFAPDMPITREQMAVMLSNYMKYTGVILPETAEAVAFSDSGEFSSWATEEVSAMQTYGILTGKGNNVFDAKGTGTRAEFCSMMERFIVASEG